MLCSQSASTSSSSFSIGTSDVVCRKLLKCGFLKLRDKKIQLHKKLLVTNSVLAIQDEIHLNEKRAAPRIIIEEQPSLEPGNMEREGEEEPMEGVEEKTYVSDDYQMNHEMDNGLAQDPNFPWTSWTCEQTCSESFHESRSPDEFLDWSNCQSASYEPSCAAAATATNYGGVEFGCIPIFDNLDVPVVDYVPSYYDVNHVLASL